MNIKYKITTSIEVENMLKEWKWTCTPKHMFLSWLLEKLWYKYKFIIVPFYYNKLLKNVPDDKKYIVDKMPLAYHTALKVYINNKWIIVDLTWDPDMKWYPVNNIIKLDENMKLAVIPESIIEIDTDPITYKKKINKNFTEEELIIRKEFYLFINDFIEKSRK